MILVDNHRVYDVDLRDTPTFPAALEERYEASTLASESGNAVSDFLGWWIAQCHLRGFPEPGYNGEDIVQIRRMLSWRTDADLKNLAVVFFNHFADPIKEGNYRHHMRLFAHHLRDCEDVLSRKAVAKTDEEKGTTFG